MLYDPCMGLSIYDHIECLQKIVIVILDVDTLLFNDPFETMQTHTFIIDDFIIISSMY